MIASKLIGLTLLELDDERRIREPEGILLFREIQYQQTTHIAFEAARKLNAAASGFDVTIKQEPDMMPVNDETIISVVLVTLVVVILLDCLRVNSISKFCRVWKMRQLLPRIVQKGL